MRTAESPVFWPLKPEKQLVAAPPKPSVSVRSNPARPAKFRSFDPQWYPYAPGTLLASAYPGLRAYLARGPFRMMFKDAT